MIKKILALSVCALAACGVQRTQPTPANFTAAINAGLANPRHVATFDSTDTCIAVSGGVKQLRALQKYGLVTIGRRDRGGERARFTFTSTGSAYRVGTDLCFANIAVEAIKNIMLMDRRAHVDYRYKILKVAAWARRPEILAAFPEIKTMLKGEDPFDARKATLVSTPDGWVARAI
jgi:hypothetical protein